MAHIYDLIIIGTGITGLAAARQARRDGLTTATIESQFFGGLVINVNHLDGPIEGSGSDLAANMMMEAADAGAESINATANSIERAGDTLVVQCDDGPHQAHAVVIASGARLKRLGIPGESDFEGMGVSQCADCDGPMFRGQDVVVVGGGDSAVQEAAVLAGYARHVHVVHRGTRFSARAHLVEQLAARSNVTLHWSTVAEAVTGEKGVQAVRVRALAGGAPREIRSAGFFAYVGLDPACEFVPAAVARDPRGFLVTGADLQTALPGVYAAGAVRAGYRGLIADAIAEGETAARNAAAARR